MRKIFRKLRGLLGLSGLGAVAGSLFGVAWGGLESVMLPAGIQLPLSFYMIGWGVIGATTAMGFGLLLATTSGRRRLEDVSPWRARALGALAGSVGPLLLVGLSPAIMLPVGFAPLIAAVGGVLGAGLGSGLIAAGKTAPDEPALSGNRSDPVLDSGTRP